jgi:hypothetical protein
MKLYTCSVCSAIGIHDNTLDDKRICQRCLHKKQHGDDVYERCSRRGYHETWSSGGELDMVEVRSRLQKERFGVEDEGYYFTIEVRCRCEVTVRAFLKSPSPIGSFMATVPTPAKHWFLIEGRYTPIYAEDQEGHQIKEIVD